MLTSGAEEDEDSDVKDLVEDAEEVGGVSSVSDGSLTHLERV